MGSVVFGANIPAPKVRIDKNLLELYADLYKGIRDRSDTISWRTLIITVRQLLGVALPDFKKVNRRQTLRGRRLVKQLTAKTYLEKLVPEIEYAVGVRGVKGRGGESLDFLLLNARHAPELIIWNLADYIKSRGKGVAVVNPVGHYNDGQTRVVGPARFFRKIKKLVILSSTQTKLGGSVSVLSNVIRLIRNPDFALRVGEVDVVIPMFGGSRGHRLGQSEEVGFEVMEAGFNAKLLSLPARDLISKLKKEARAIPKIRFFSIDIHNSLYPQKTFNEEGFEFISLDPSPELAERIVKVIRSKKLTKIPLKLIACDKGAVPRTQKLAERILFSKPSLAKSLQVIYLEKKRLGAGVVTATQIQSAENWKKEGKRIIRTSAKIPQKPIFAHTIVVYSDDMIDTGGTAQKDLSFISSYYPNTSLKIFAATHPVFSKGLGAIKRIGADYFVLGNTLNIENLEEVGGVFLVDLSPAIFEAIS